jgi:hypothetical protein
VYLPVQYLEFTGSNTAFEVQLPEIVEGMHYRLPVKVKNSTGHLLKLGNWRSECHCTAVYASETSTVVDGGIVNALVAIDAKGIIDEYSKEVEALSEDGTYLFAIRLRAICHPRLTSDRSVYLVKSSATMQRKRDLHQVPISLETSLEPLHGVEVLLPETWDQLASCDPTKFDMPPNSKKTIKLDFPVLPAAQHYTLYCNFLMDGELLHMVRVSFVHNPFLFANSCEVIVKKTPFATSIPITVRDGIAWDRISVECNNNSVHASFSDNTIGRKGHLKLTVGDNLDESDAVILCRYDKESPIAFIIRNLSN